MPVASDSPMHFIKDESPVHSSARGNVWLNILSPLRLS